MTTSDETRTDSAEDSQEQRADWEDQAVYGPSTVIAALNQIEDTLVEARAVPLTALVTVNRAELLDLVDQARDALPEDLVAADAVVADADAVLGRADSAAELTIAEATAKARALVEDAQQKADLLVEDAQQKAESTISRANDEAARTLARAKDDADAILSDAKLNAERLVATENISRMAEDRARQIVADARHQDEQLRRGADEYVATSLGELAHLLADLQRRTDAGRRAVAERNGFDSAELSLDND